jgi:glucose/arabinose dehydrogenase
MNANVVHALSRRAAHSISRRGTLLTLGGALAAAAAPSLAQAKKNTKKAKKKARRKAQERAAEQAENQANQACQNQVAGCRAHILAVCQLPDGKCVAAADSCSSLGTCNVTEFFARLVAVATAGN